MNCQQIIFIIVFIITYIKKYIVVLKYFNLLMIIRKKDNNKNMNLQIMNKFSVLQRKKEV